MRRKPTFKPVVAMLTLLCGLPVDVAAKETPFVHQSHDGFKLDAKLALPDGVKESAVARVVVLVHGSGPQNMDLDLSAVTENKGKNLLFKEISDALVQKGFAVLRYHKRSYHIKKMVEKDKAYAKSKEFEAFMRSYLKHIIEDAKSMALYAKQRFPKAKVYYLGGSQGSYVALQAAHQLKNIDGVANFGFYATSLATCSFEQVVYRPLYILRRADKNHDEILTKAELEKADAELKPLLLQLEQLDVDKDGAVSFMEVMGGNFVHLLKPIVDHKYRKQEAEYPPVGKILYLSKFKVLFFQGLWDNQTPAYHTIAVQFAAKHQWKKDNMRFHFFPKRGHILHPQKRYDELVYRRIDPQILSKIAAEMDTFFK